jgi:hypothetical protein
MQESRPQANSLSPEQKQYKAAVIHLQQTTDGMVNNIRAYYNYRQLLDFLHRNKEAEAALRRKMR